MQNFRAESATLNGNTVVFGAVGESHRVTITVERKDGKSISENEGRRIYTAALDAFPQVVSVGRVSD